MSSFSRLNHNFSKIISLFYRGKINLDLCQTYKKSAKAVSTKQQQSAKNGYQNEKMVFRQILVNLLSKQFHSEWRIYFSLSFQLVTIRFFLLELIGSLTSCVTVRPALKIDSLKARL